MTESTTIIAFDQHARSVMAAVLGPLDAAPDVVDGPARIIEGADAGWLDTVIPSCTPSTYGRSRSQARRQQALTLETLERRMHGTGRHVPLKPQLHRLQNRAAVRVFA